MSLRSALPVLLVLLGGTPPAPAAEGGGGLERFVGAYVGRAEEAGAAGEQPEQRDIDLVIAPHGKDGLTLSWTNVTLVGGRRDVPGVRRRADQVHLVPADGRGFYLAREAYDPFSEREPPQPLAGAPLRWATVRDGLLRTYSFVILEDGRYELQTYTRSLDGQGAMTLDWRRLVDGALVRAMTGRAVRAD